MNKYIHICICPLGAMTRLNLTVLVVCSMYLFVREFRNLDIMSTPCSHRNTFQQQTSTDVRRFPNPAPCRFVAVPTVVHQYHAPMTALEIDFAPDHRRHRDHELLRDKSDALRKTSATASRQSFRTTSAKHFSQSCLRELESYLRSSAIGAHPSFLSLPDLSSASEPLPRSRESIVTGQPFPLFASLRLRSPHITRSLSACPSTSTSSRTRCHAILSLSQSLFTKTGACFCHSPLLSKMQYQCKPNCPAIPDFSISILV